jgi:hypothetical protein
MCLPPLFREEWALCERMKRKKQGQGVRWETGLPCLGVDAVPGASGRRGVSLVIVRCSCFQCGGPGCLYACWVASRVSKTSTALASWLWTTQGGRESASVCEGCSLQVVP